MIHTNVTTANPKAKSDLVILTEGDNQTGMGHLRRATDIAMYIDTHYSTTPHLYIYQSSAARSLLEALSPSFPITWIEQNAELTDVSEPTVLTDLFDAHTNRRTADHLRKRSNRLISIGNEQTPTEVPVHDYINPNPLNIREKKNFFADRRLPERVFFGLDYFVPSKSIRQAMKSTKRQQSQYKHVLVVIGGGDEEGLVLRIAETLLKLSGADVRVIPSPASPYREQINQLEQRNENLSVMVNVKDMGSQIQWADLVISTHGNVAYEVYGIGVPLVAFSLNESQKQQAKLFDSMGACVYFERKSLSVLKKELLSTVHTLLNSEMKRKRMLDAQAPLVDSKGIKRIADIITSND